MSHPLRAVLLTTHDRPELLARSLPQIMEQTQRLGVPLVIADDGSTDARALELLRGAEAQGALVWMSGEAERLHGVFATGRRFCSAVRGLSEIVADGAFLKVDDDVILADDCFEALASAWPAVSTVTPSLSAMLDVFTTPRHDGPAAGTVVTDWSSSVCCVHRMDMWAAALAAMGDGHFIRHGWDVGFFWHWLSRRAYGQPLTLVPSRAYHAGHVGTRTRGDLNRYPPDAYAMAGIVKQGDFNA